MPKKRESKGIELSPEDFAKVLEDLEDFENKSLMYLAQSDRYEIIPTADEETGKVLSREDLETLKHAVENIGSKILYRIDKPTGETLIVDLDSLKTIVYVEGMQ